MKILRVLTTIALVGIASIPARAGDASHTMEDLQALEKEGSWEELARHLKDVSPSKRNDAWKKLAERVALQQLESAEDLVSLNLMETLPKEYPFLKQSKEYRSARNKRVLKAGEACRDAGDDCLDRVRRLAEDEPVDGEFSFQVGKIVARQRSISSAVPFFERAVRGRSNPKECGDGDLQNATVAGLGLPAGDTRLPKARALAFGPCWVEMKDRLIHEFDKGGKEGYLATNACADLKKKKAKSTSCE